MVKFEHILNFLAELGRHDQNINNFLILELKGVQDLKPQAHRKAKKCCEQAD